MAKARFTPNYTIGKPGLDTAGLRSAAQADPDGFMHKMNGLIDSGELSWSSIRDIKRLYNALGDVDVTTTIEIAGQQRAVTTSAFPLLTGGLTIAAINEAYEGVPTIGQELVTEMEDNKRNTVIAGITSDNPAVDGVKEGDDYPEIGASEEKFEVRSKRNGRRLSITAEMIEENDIANIVSRINALGEIAAETIEEQTLRRVFDIDGSATSPAEPYVLHFEGAAASLYSVTANTPGTRAPSGTRINSNALVDTTDLETARARLASMKNSRGKRIAIPMSQCQIVVPDALAGTAMKILNSELEPSVENEINNWGPRGAYRPMLLTSPKIDDLSTTVWYLGNFKKQFVRKWKLRFEYVSLGNSTESYLRSRLAAQFRIGWDCEIGARDYVYVVQNLSATTAP